MIEDDSSYFGHTEKKTLCVQENNDVVTCKKKKKKKKKGMREGENFKLPLMCTKSLT